MNSTTGSIWRNRSSTTPTPMSGLQLDQTAPMLAQARNATTVSGRLGMYEATRSPARTPCRRSQAASAPTSRVSCSHDTSRTGSPSARAMSAGRAGVAGRNTCSA